MLTTAKVASIVESGFAAAGELIFSATVERETGQATYDPATMKMTGSSTTSSPCRALFSGNDGKSPSEAGVVEVPQMIVIYLADLSANPPKISDRLRVGADLYAIEEVEDSSAGTRLLFKTNCKRV